ncbi:GAF domain-containing sensor histidine kinase [Litoribacillus peritrichatus]|uniref:histidine kinase n=1 Tax=Litoribacillus peritrichatus TaxID=718191 RepID=A0ABP7NAV3_9GAMM
MDESDPRPQLTTEAGLSEAIDSGDFKRACEAVKKTIHSVLNVPRVSIWLTDKDTASLCCLDHNSATPITPNTCDLSALNNYINALEQTGVLSIDEESQSPGAKDLIQEYLQPSNAVSLLDTAIYRDGCLVGILRAESLDEVRNWAEQEQALLVHMSDLLSRALIARDLESLKSRYAEVKAVISNTQQQIIELEKMATLGNLVAGVTHEINTPIGIGITTISHLEFLTSQIEQAFTAGSITEKHFNTYIHSVNEACQLLTDNLNRAADLIQSFKQVAVDQSDDTFLLINLEDTLKNITNSVRPELNKKYQTKMKLTCEPHIHFKSCPGSLAQVLTNLLINAGIHAFDQHHKDRKVCINAHKANDQIIIEVRDNGDGVPFELQPKIFEPFVTTKRGAGGSGLGLNIVRTLVQEKLKGSISMESQPGEFTTFIIRLPSL